jgi:hypothetical protein
MANVVVSALATWNGKALKKAKQDVSSFDKQIKSLGRTFGVTFSAAAIVAFSKKAINAFTADEAAAKSLELQLINTGNAFRVDEVEGYIKSLEKTYAILTDLRKPFQTFLNLTGSVELAQRSLEAALNISAGTGESLETVVGAISSGIRGQTKAIKGLNTGIDANIIASGDMNKIMEALEKRFSGQAAARLDTYAGKMNILKKGVDEATKAIGEGLVNSIEILSEDTSIQGLADSFENMGDNIAYATEQMAKLIKGFSDLVGSPSFKAGLLATGLLLSGRTGNPKFFLAAMGVVGGTGALGVLAKDYSSKASANTANVRENRLNQAFRTSIKYRTIENDQIKAKTELDKLKDKFDVERIGLMKALGEATDAETKLRLEAKIAILDNNEALAKKINAELEAAKKAKELADAFGGAASQLTAQIAKMQAMNDALINKINEKIAAGAYTPPPGLNIPGISQLFPTPQGPLGSIDYTVPMGSGNPVYAPGTSGTPMSYADVRLTIDVAQAGDQFAQLIADSVQVAQRSGYSTTSAGSLN